MGSPNDEILLRVDDARCEIPTPHGTIIALGGVSLTVRRGETLGVVGESGCGKSTLSKFIIGALNPAHVTGSVILNGSEITAMPKRAAAQFRGRRIGMVFQDPMMALNPVVPIGRQVSETMRKFLGLNRADAEARTVSLLDQVGIPDAARRLRQYPHQFSGGLRQRVTIAMALACDPDLLIADEATTALDVTVQRQILDLLSELAERRGLSMIMVSHDLSVIAGRTNHTAVMYGGLIVEQALTADLFRSPQHPYTQALLRSIPTTTMSSHVRLHTIPGVPPNLARLGVGCSYAPRCERASELCSAVRPGAEPRLDAHGSIRCHFPDAMEDVHGAA
jgi:peptide/nickel transport system ATP-binding protein